MARSESKSVFLNIPYDTDFEQLYLAYTTGLTMLGLTAKLTLAVPHDISRLETIIRLIQSAHYSIHDLSRVTSAGGVPRFNMPLELGLALYRSRTEPGRHQVYIFEQENYRIQRSTSDLNGLDPFIHNGTPRQIMARLRSIFLPEGQSVTVPKMMSAFERLIEALPAIKEKAGTDSIYEAAIFNDILLALSLWKNKSQA